MDYIGIYLCGGYSTNLWISISGIRAIRGITRILGLKLIAEFGLEIKKIRKPSDATEEGPLLLWVPSVKGEEAVKKTVKRVILARVSYGDGYFVFLTAKAVIDLPGPELSFLKL